MLFMRTPSGPVNAFLNFIGIANPPGWFSTTRWALPGVIIVGVWRYMGLLYDRVSGGLAEYSQGTARGGKR
jgi:ABC-type sugar transport system permease subunit